MTGTEKSSKCDIFRGWGRNLMPTKFGNFRVQADLRKQRCDFSPEAARRRLFFLGRIAQNVSHLFLHTAAVPLGAALQPRLNRPLDITNHKLRHTSLPW